MLFSWDLESPNFGQTLEYTLPLIDYTGAVKRKQLALPGFFEVAEIPRGTSEERDAARYCRESTSVVGRLTTDFSNAKF